MNRKGFTLVELLGVIIILSLLMLIVLPRITNSTRNSSTKTDKVTEQLIFDATALYLNDNEGNYRKIDGSIYCIDLNELVNSEYLKSPLKMSYDGDIINTKIVEASYDNGYSYKLMDSGSCITKIQPNQPNLLDGSLTPIKYNGSNWIVVDGTKSDWYNYDNQEWANAVILNTGVTKNIGDTVNIGNEAKAIFVWIPRYEYKIEGQYGKGGTSTSSPGEIEINFVTKIVTKANEGYRIHPAFTFGDEELTGIWVGKFETGHITLSSSTKQDNLGCSNETCANADGLRILPNVTSLRYNNISNMFYAARSMTRSGNGFGLSSSNVDSHLMKNSEWGAVAYFSQSKYGKYGNNNYVGEEKEVRLNNCSNKITGIGAESQNASESSTTCTTNTYETEKGQTASTTGNITGVYDMSGGTWEYVMGYLAASGTIWGANSSTNDAGFTSKPEAKYFDEYTGTTAATACSGGICYGHALSETSKWYQDYLEFISASRPWVIRGAGSGEMGVSAGIFSSMTSRGSTSYISFRAVLTPTINY